MRGTKKLVAFSLACTMALSTGMLVGCGGKEEAKNDEVKFSIFQFKVEAKDALDKAVKAYEEKNPNIRIDVQTVGGGDDYGASLKSKFASGEEPAIFNIGGPQDTLDWKDSLENLSDEPWVKDAFDKTLDGVKMDGKIYGMPFAQEGYGFVYNKDIFSKAGIDSDKIKTYTDLEEAVKIIDSKKSDLGLDAVFALAGKENWIQGLHLSNAILSNEFADARDAFEAKKVEFKYSEAMKKLLDLEMQYAYKPDGSNKSLNSVDYSTQIEKEFSLGKVAITQQGNWVYGAVNDVDSEIAKNIGILPIPVDGVKDGAIPVGVPMYWAVNSKLDDNIKKAAKDFLNWLYTSDDGKEMIINDFNFIPAFKGYDTESLQPKDPLAKDILNYVNNGNTMSWVFMGYPTGWGEHNLGAAIQKYFSDEYTWDQVINEAKDSWADARK